MSIQDSSHASGPVAECRPVNSKQSSLPVDLKVLFGERYKVVYEQSYAAEHGDRGRRPDPWLLQLLCKHGHIYPQGGSRLAASTNRRGKIANLLAGLDCVYVHQDGDDGINVTFDVSDFDQIASILKPRKLRKLSPSHLAAIQRGREQWSRKQVSEDENSPSFEEVEDLPT